MPRCQCAPMDLKKNRRGGPPLFLLLGNLKRDGDLDTKHKTATFEQLICVASTHSRSGNRQQGRAAFPGVLLLSLFQARPLRWWVVPRAAGACVCVGCGCGVWRLRAREREPGAGSRELRLPALPSPTRAVLIADNPTGRCGGLGTGGAQGPGGRGPSGQKTKCLLGSGF
jgi:hypothetical protein